MTLKEFLIKVGIAPDVCTELVFGSRINYKLDVIEQGICNSLPLEIVNVKPLDAAKEISILVE